MLNERLPVNELVGSFSDWVSCTHNNIESSPDCLHLDHVLAPGSWLPGLGDGAAVAPLLEVELDAGLATHPHLHQPRAAERGPAGVTHLETGVYIDIHKIFYYLLEHVLYTIETMNFCR